MHLVLFFPWILLHVENKVGLGLREKNGWTYLSFVLDRHNFLVQFIWYGGIPQTCHMIEGISVR